MDSEPCHSDACALFIGGDNLINISSKVLEDWIKENRSIENKSFCHVMKKKKDDYGFIHFESVEKKDKFYKELKGKRVLVNEENKVIINFQLVKRNESRNKNDSVGRGPPPYNLYDNGAYFIILISLLIADKTELELFTDEEDFLIISGEHREIGFSGEIIKKFIPTGKFEFKIQLPSRVDSKANIEWMQEFNLYKIELKKSDVNKRRKLYFD